MSSDHVSTPDVSTGVADPREILAEAPMRMRQYAAVGLCIVLLALDGFDVLSISFASPGIAAEWGIDRAALGVVLSMELIGMAVGSIVLGNVADRIGRKPLLLVCLVVMAIGMYLASTAGSVGTLSIYRLFTGIGIGGMLAATNAVVAEFSNRRNKALAVALMAGGYPLGAIVGGSIASSILANTGNWRGVFLFGAAVTAALIPIVFFLLPESVGFLVQKRPANVVERVNKVMRKLGQQTITALPEHLHQAPKTSIKQLFTGDLRRVTILLTAAYFCHIMTFYYILKWIPKIVVDMGFEPSTAGGVLVWANVGGLLGSIVFSILSLRFSARTMVIVAMVASTAMIIVFGQGQTSLSQLSVVAAAAGFFTNAAVVGIYAIIAMCYPSSVRAGGTGFVIGTGRGGAALGPIIAGVLFSANLGLQGVSIVMALGSLVAAFVLLQLKPSASQQHL
ncbi:MAG: MFS transporter [Actinomycetales bacterium]